VHTDYLNCLTNTAKQTNLVIASSVLSTDNYSHLINKSVTAAQLHSCLKNSITSKINSNVFGYPSSPSQELHFLNERHYFIKHNTSIIVEVS